MPVTKISDLILPHIRKLPAVPQEQRVRKAGVIFMSAALPHADLKWTKLRKALCCQRIFDTGMKHHTITKKRIFNS